MAASKKRCLVSEEMGGAWSLRAFFNGRLTLEEVDALAAFAEAYVLHDQVSYIGEGVRNNINALISSLPGSKLVIRWHRPSTSIHRLFRSAIDKFLRADLKDYQIALRALRHNDNEGGQLPDRVRSARDWLGIETRLNVNLIQAELAVSSRIGATYYPSPSGQRVIRSELRDFSKAGASLLRAFGSARAAALQTAQVLLEPDDTDLSPPLILAYAVESADTIQGLISVLKDLRASREVRDLRSLVTRLSFADPAEKIKLAHIINAEFKAILGIKGEPLITAKEVIQSVPTISTQDLLVAVPNAAVGLIKITDFIEKLRVQRSLRVLRKAHFRVMDVKGLYAGLSRLFGATEFDEISLKAFLERRIVVKPSREDVERWQRMERDTAERLERLNKAIERARNP